MKQAAKFKIGDILLDELDGKHYLVEEVIEGNIEPNPKCYGLRVLEDNITGYDPIELIERFLKKVG